MRRATADDAARLSLIGSATFLETFANDHHAHEVIRHLAANQSPEWWRAALGAPAAAAWLVEEAEGCPVGYAMTQPSKLPGTDPLTDHELKRIYILSKWHGGGWGAQLYAAAEAEARARGAARLVLSVYVKNAHAIEFYERRGFSAVGRWEWEGFDKEDFIFARSL